MAEQRRSRIQSLARKCLRENAIEEPPVPIERIAAQLGANLQFAPFDGQLSGMVFRHRGQTIIGVNSLHAAVRRRFTIAHEIGHLLLQPEQEFHVDSAFTVKFRGPNARSGMEPEEIAANCFAAEVLMPIEFLEADLADQEIDGVDSQELIERLASRYQVSAQAMTIRLTNLGLGDALGISASVRS